MDLVRPTLFILCGLVGGAAFLSTASSKLITYALPLYPAVAILAAQGFDRFVHRELGQRVDVAFTWIFGFLCAGGCVFPFALLVGLDRYTGRHSPAPAFVVAAIAAAATALALVFMARDQRTRAVAMGLAWFGLLFVAVMTWPMQDLAGELSQKSLGRRLVLSSRLPDKVVVVGQHIGSLLFYLTPEQRRVLRPGQFVEAEGNLVDPWTAVPPGVLLAMTPNAVDDTPDGPLKATMQRAALDGALRWADGGMLGASAGRVVR